MTQSPLRLTLVAGARPNFMKIAPIIRAIEQVNADKHRLVYRLVHTGQHFDKEMSESFFKELDLPEPNINLGVGSGSHAEQTAEIMIGFERELSQNPTDIVVVVGDVNSTLACSIVAKKMHVKLAHIEAGVRSGDQTMPEEINRMVTDSISDYFFTTSEMASKRLAAEGAKESNIFFVGNTMIDTLNALRSKFTKPNFWDEFGLFKQSYLVMTLHRPANVDEPRSLEELLHNISGAAEGNQIVFPMHPRTAKSLLFIEVPENIRVVPPQSYLHFNYLVEHARGVITDSGGVTTETTVMNIPCLTLRDTTEWPETITHGTNELIGNDPNKIWEAIGRMVSGKWKSAESPPKWDGKSAERIVEKLQEIFIEGGR